MCFFCVRLFFVLLTPPLGAGGVVGNFATACGTGLCDFSPFQRYNFASPPLAAVVTLLWVFAFPSTRFRPALPPPVDMAVVFINVFTPFRIGPFLSLFTWRSLSAS